jgi:hypothetical protein
MYSSLLNLFIIKVFYFAPDSETQMVMDLDPQSWVPTTYMVVAQSKVSEYGIFYTTGTYPVSFLCIFES